MSPIETAARRFLPNYRSLQAVPSGLSGGRVYRVIAADGDFALKQYPTGFNPDRLREIHAMQLHTASKLNTVPTLVSLGDGVRLGSKPAAAVTQSSETLLFDSDHWFDCSRWLPGKPLSGDSPWDNIEAGLRLIAAGAGAIAEFHEAVGVLGIQRTVAPAVLERLAKLRELPSVLASAIAAARQQPSDLLPNPWQLAAACLENWLRSGVTHAQQCLASWSETRLPIQWVLRDVHREHVLFQDEQVSGLIDFDAARRDTVATDLARWAGSFIDLGLEKTRIWEAVWSGYQAVRPISACEQQLAGAMEEISWYLRLANWVVWVALEKRVFPDSAIRPETRLCMLLRRSGSFNAI